MSLLLEICCLSVAQEALFHLHPQIKKPKRPAGPPSNLPSSPKGSHPSDNPQDSKFSSQIFHLSSPLPLEGAQRGPKGQTTTQSHSKEPELLYPLTRLDEYPLTLPATSRPQHFLLPHFKKHTGARCHVDCTSLGA